jgi:hypothetical protein
MSTQTAYAVVQCTDYRTPNPKIVAKHGISDITSQADGMFQITFEENFFGNIPAVQVTAMFNGYQGTSLAPIDSPSIPVGYAPANQMVTACILWTTSKACQIRTSLSDQHFGNWLSFSITASGTE